jgi:hypothetical protein
LGQILDRYRTSQNWQPLPDDDHNQMVAAWLEVLEVSGVPVEHYDSCYRAARQTQIELKAKGESVGPLGAEDLAVEWVKLRELHAEMQREEMRHRALTESAAAACQRCLGRKPAVDTCDHRPLSEEELMTQAEAYAENARALREMLAKKPAVKSMPAEEFKMDLSVTYTCTDCARKVKSEFGWNYHDRCNQRIPGPVRDGEKHGCRGVMEVL